MKILSHKKGYIIFTGIVLFIALLLFAAPRVASRYIVKHGPEIIGRNISIEKIRINYFTGTLQVNDLKLYEADAKTVFLSFKQLKVNLDYLPLLKNEFSVRYISLDDPYVEVLQDGSKFNFSDLTASDTTTVKKDTIPQEPTKYIINDIHISGGYVKYTDLALNHTISLDSLDLAIPGFTWNSDSTNLNVDFHFVDGGGLYSKLDINQADSTYSINLKLDSLNLGIIEPYIQNYANISALHGYLSNDLIIKGSMQNLLNLFVHGNNHVYGLQMLDAQNRKIFSFNDLSVDIDTLQLDKNNIRLSNVRLTDPYILFELIDSTNNWLALMKPPTPEQPDSLAQPSDTTGTEPAFSYNFPDISISGGKVEFADKTLRYPFMYLIDILNIESKEVSGKLAFHVSAGLNGTGTIISDAMVDPDNLHNDMNLDLKIDQFRMKDMDAYFKHYLGFPVTGGIMNFNTRNQIRSNSLVSDNTIFFRHLTLAERMKAETEYKVPLRLAIGVLSDKDGVIDLKAPVKMKGEEVKISNLGRIIFRIVGNLFVKAAIAPVNLLAGLVDADPVALQEIRLGLSEPAPDIKNMKSVDIIAGILKKKPLLNADFIYCINQSRAADTVAYIMALNDFRNDPENRQINQKSVPDSTLAGYIIKKSGAGQSGSDLVILCRNYIGQDRLNARLDSLKSIQTVFIANYLNRDMELSKERFRIIEITPDSIMPSVRYPAFRVFFNAGDKE